MTQALSPRPSFETLAAQAPQDEGGDCFTRAFAGDDTSK
jgi:hypothetical protein